MKVVATAIRADGDGTIVVWQLPSGHEMAVRYKLSLSKYLAQPAATEGTMTVPFENSADLAPPKLGAHE